MRVVFISPDFETIVELPKDYNENSDIYHSFLDFKNSICPEATDEHFLKHYDTYNVYFRSLDKYPEELTYVGKLFFRYIEAKQVLAGEWDDNKLEESLYLLFANCP